MSSKPKSDLLKMLATISPESFTLLRGRQKTIYCVQDKLFHSWDAAQNYAYSIKLSSKAIEEIIHYSRKTVKEIVNEYQTKSNLEKDKE